MKEMDKLGDIEDNFLYEDIINLEYHKSTKYPHLSIASRAGQFAPFAALSGYSDEVYNAERYVLPRVDLEEDRLNYLDNVIKNIKYNDLIKVNYFSKDIRKDGGKYLEVYGRIKKIDYINKNIIFKDKTIIMIKDIVKIEKINIQDNDNLI